MRPGSGGNCIMLTVEIKDPDEVRSGKSEVEIYCDQEGLDELLRQLSFLKQGETHVHLMSPSWAGNELTERPQGPGNVLVHHLRIVFVNHADR